MTITAHASAGAAAVDVKQVRVAFTVGARAKVKVASLVDRVLTVGRDAACDVPLPDSECSRLHAEIRPRDDEPGTWEIVDQGSRNGMFVDGRRCTSAPLCHGTVIRVGRSILVTTMQRIDPLQPLQPDGAGLWGASLAMQAIRGEIATVAKHDLAVLVCGPTGVGKELVARAIHEASGRKGDLVAVNCAALPAALAESELFGHVAGAFTGATRANPGLVAAAAGGTLFLDEIGEMPLELQAKLLRVLADRQVRAVGATRSETIDVRIVAATNVDLAAAIAAGRFRDDLWARLAGWRVVVPALAERRDDVLPIAYEILRRRGSDADAGLEADAAEALVLHDWPYNVRELEQVLASTVVRAGGAPAIRLAHVPVEIGAIVRERVAASTEVAAASIVLTIDRTAMPSAADLRRVIEHFAGNLAEVARFFGKDRRQIYRWMDRHGLARGEERED